uniref:Cadherin domain-containing protein n=1 Tax=Vombatus ursinus TaxID=29139 RepID=A0A4X2KBG5_VOMUR
MEASGWALGLLPLLLFLPGAKGQTQVCSVNQNLFSVKENEVPTEPLANVTAPVGQMVVVSDLSNPADIFKIANGELRLTRAPDYETHTVLTAILECKEGSHVVTRLPVIVVVINVNDMTPEFPFSSKTWNVSENTNVGTTVIPATELTATDKDGDTLFYSLLGKNPPDAELFFSLAGVNFPALRLAQTLDYEKNPIMVLHLLARDTPKPQEEPSHTATATITIQVLAADIRPPWFLPCVFTDGRICIHAQYRGAVPTGSVLTEPLTFEPGPVYAIDGDTSINEPIRYSIIRGNTDNTFQIGVDSGNITMAKAVPVPETFNLLVQAQQQWNTGSYSVTQVTIQAVAGQLHPPRFPQALYRGWLPPGTGINVAVKDAEDPDRELRLRAEDDDFPAGAPNSGLRYQIANSSAFRMSGEVVLTNDIVGPPQVLYLQAEVLDELTSEKDTTTIEILVQDTKPTPPESTTQGSGTQTSPTSRSTPTRPPTQDSPEPPSPAPTLVPPHSGTTVKPSTATPTQGPPAPGPGPAPTPAPPHSGTTVKPSAATPTQSSPGPPGPGPSGGSQTGAPGGITGKTSAAPGGLSSEPNVSSATSPGPIGPSRPTGDQEQQGSTVNEMAIVGGVLGALLLVTLILLAVFIYKRNKCQKSDLSSMHGTDLKASGYDNKSFQAQESPNGSAFSSPSPEPGPEPQPLEDDPPEGPGNGPAPCMPELEMAGPEVREAKEEMGEDPEQGSPRTGKEGPVRSILTKERKSEDGGYKAVWFGGDIGAQVDVVVINSPAPEEPHSLLVGPEEPKESTVEENESGDRETEA